MKHVTDLLNPVRMCVSCTCSRYALLYNELGERGDVRTFSSSGNESAKIQGRGSLRPLVFSTVAPNIFWVAMSLCWRFEF